MFHPLYQDYAANFCLSTRRATDIEDNYFFLKNKFLKKNNGIRKVRLFNQ